MCNLNSKLTRVRYALFLFSKNVRK